MHQIILSFPCCNAPRSLVFVFQLYSVANIDIQRLSCNNFIDNKSYQKKNRMLHQLDLMVPVIEPTLFLVLDHYRDRVGSLQ